MRARWARVAAAQNHSSCRSARRWSSLLWLGVITASALLSTACSERCRDQDGDGFGPGCERGPDCDDDNRRLGASCDDAARACAMDPIAEGCPCLPRTRRACFTGEQAALGVGLCRAGRRSCEDERWGACEDEIAPEREQCNERDDDCDGRTDERVQSPCGGCDPECTGGVWGRLDAPFVADDGLSLTPQGELTLTRTSIPSAYAFIPNAGDGTLSKIDTGRVELVARHPIPGQPEHVAVDHLGDVFVLSPNAAGASALTKVAGTGERCLDADGDGLITASGADGPLPEGQDECVLWTVPVGDAGEVARTLTVDGTTAPDAELGGHVWVGLQGGLQDQNRLLQLRGDTGTVLREVGGLGVSPQAATFDPWGRLWVLDRSGVLARVDLRDEPALIERVEAPLRCYELESMISDDDGVLWLTGLSCEDVVSYDPSTDDFDYLKLPGVLDARAAAVVGDEVWVTHTGGLLSRLSRGPLTVRGTFELAANGFAPVETVAIGADADGALWTVSTFGGSDGRGVLTRFDPASEVVDAALELGRFPRAQGDITGDRRQSVAAAEARTEHTFAGCTIEDVDGNLIGQPTRWKQLHVQLDYGPGASVAVAARHAASSDALGDAAYQELGVVPGDAAPFVLPFPVGGVVQVAITLRARDRIGAPRISQIGVEWSCAGPD